ncbi:MAG: hypothetical protein P8H31_01805, partial [Porticoccaceae bacterium]|nr:hypothetical protein [Porticoccaceae bacterium]
MHQNNPAAKIAVSIWLISLLTLAGCASKPDISPQQTAPPDFPHSIYTEADNGSSVYKVDSNASQILITVRRGGLMASLGHDHIVASHDLQGYILIEQNPENQNQACRADFYAPIAQLEVDNAELRRQANLLTTPSAKDIAGTTANMLKSIAAADFPFARLHSSDCLAALSGEQAEVLLTIHGANQTQKIAINIEEVNEEKIILRG